MRRRQFVKSAGASVLVPGVVECLFRTENALAEPESELEYVEARHFKQLPERKVECTLCPRSCLVDDTERGYCGVRENKEGTYYTLVHSRPCTYHVDPIEKKPLFHFLPGTTAFSLSTAGCNVECRFCQNWEISQTRPEQIRSLKLSPKEIVRLTRNQRAPTIAYTYGEPVVFWEYMVDCAAEGAKEGIRSVMISNGYIQAEPMKQALEFLDAVKIDLKAFTEKFYKELVSGELRPVLDTLELLAASGCWFEIVHLTIPKHNDDPEDIRRLSRWVKAELGDHVPIHFTRFYPQYKLKNHPPTAPATLDRCRQIAIAEGLKYVYSGNVPMSPGENTLCPACDELLIRRYGYRIGEMKIRNGKCAKCGEPIPGVWS
jgi:pyruvate formate lyase activating enzyme